MSNGINGNFKLGALQQIGYHDKRNKLVGKEQKSLTPIVNALAAKLRVEVYQITDFIRANAKTDSDVPVILKGLTDGSLKLK